MNDYHINIFYSQADEGYIADIPDLRSCSAFGETPADALHELEIAKALWLEAAEEVGLKIPLCCLIKNSRILWAGASGIGVCASSKVYIRSSSNSSKPA